SMLIYNYTPQQERRGEEGLIYGVGGTTNFGDVARQGYQSQDLIAVVDLGRTQKVSKLGAGFLQNVESWIWMPRSVDFEISTDGVNFVHALSLTNDVSDRDYGAVIKDMAGTIPTQPARYVKVNAHNNGKYPASH